MTTAKRLPTSIATVGLSGSLPDKLEAAAAAGFDGVKIFENDLLTFDGTPAGVRRMCEALGLAAALVQADPRTLMLTTADPDAGGMQVIGPNPAPNIIRVGQARPERDRNGQRHPFAISWSALTDVSGGILGRGVGLNSEFIGGTMDNVDVYRIMYRTMFGEVLN